MFPTIEIFGLSLGTYGITTAVGLILMGLVAIKLSRNFFIKIEDIVLGEVFSLIGGFIGAHILYGITNLDYIAKAIGIYNSTDQDGEFLWKAIYAAVGGMVFYGGLLGALGFGMIYCKIRHINVKYFADSFAVGIPLFHAFGRLGCFLSGCCYGIESTFGFTATNALVDSCNNVNRFPVQLLEGGLNIILFVVLLLLFKSENFKGSMIFMYLAGYSIIRFFDEFLRGDTYRGIWLGLSTSQWISVVLFAVSIVFLIRFFKNKQKVEFVYRG